ncbi:FAD-dependent oxidoreductase [Microlunatus sp. GCM10028923]|uniref:FAD-dependent oxidoreductase n=1 Tax=Microlunatus sp. GCM10028923 TaxID=3273400 RepID=UPI0036186F93
MTKTPETHPVVVIGAGPVGLAAAAHLVERGLDPIVLEQGEQVGAAIRDWGQVRLFSPWQYDIDAAARRLLQRAGWTEPDPDGLPTGADLLDQYLVPLAATPELASRIRTSTRVIGVSRRGIDKTRTIDREDQPLLVRTVRDGQVEDIEAKAVIDASGTWGHPNPLGSSGLAAPGEHEAAGHLAGPLPDVLGASRTRFAGRHTVVVGMGHSAANTLLALAELADAEPGTKITWLIRRGTPARLYGGGDADGLPARGRLGTSLKAAVESGKITLVRNATITRLTATDDGPVSVEADTRDGAQTWQADAIVNATGFRPDLDLLRELRLELDAGTEAPVRLAPMIDPNFHSCGSVPPHGESVLSHPEQGFYLAGAKSYGRAPTFLLATGYEQVRSIAAALADDRAAADLVQLNLPETGVCSSNPPTEEELASGTATDSACCGSSPEPQLITVGFRTGQEHGLAGERERADA